MIRMGLQRECLRQGESINLPPGRCRRKGYIREVIPKKRTCHYASSRKRWF